MTSRSDQAWDADPHDNSRAARAADGPSLWRWYLRTHFTWPNARPAGIAVGSLALALAGLLNVISLVAVIATCRSRLQHGLDPHTARDLYEVGRFAVYPAIIALMILGIPVLSRLLRWWVLLVPGLVLTAGLLNLSVPPAPL